jgi:hypothetical protein
VVLAPPSNTDAFLLRDTSVSSPQLNRRIWSKISVPHPWKPWKGGSIPFNNYLNSQSTTMCWMLHLPTWIVLFWETHVCL